MHIRFATKEDTPTILSFIQGIAEYERLSHEVETTEQKLNDTLFGDRPFAEVLICFEEETPVGFALFFHNYSTFRAKPGVYLEDLFVLPQHRNNGYGKALLNQLIQTAKDRNCGRVEWSVLDWNKPAIEFYERMGAKAMDEWTVYRITL